MLYLILVIVIAALIVGPSYWVKHTLAKYSHPEDRYPGTGAELARILLDWANLQTVKVEVTEQGDHYDPIEKVVRLTADKFNGKSLTAITVAAHEVGHAIQDRDGYLPLKWRTRLVQIAAPAEKLGAVILMIAPIVAVGLRAPAAGALFLAGGLLTLGSAVIVHMVTLPMELHASFARALPMLEQGKYLIQGDEPHARRILRAAAWTYVSASLMALLNIGRWWAILRR
ncbi:MAG: zinc metallopeptidase [Nitrosomonas sp.]|jgi:Zn-dependent membrane protease YugP|uniref:Zinc metallopeptidase n=1 Tax=Nitrosomonas oligotropha TaxID=42354 RepID=A0A5C7VZV2_9PROT|nr:zinc metallopeptidase [Nitrosomonas sp.]MBP9100856.1 zinc metallopeptidase [Nitrosomonas sp.]TXI30609.1 MAG: zinc metallopeptidase [Nitrosomonas oligotropha]